MSNQNIQFNKDVTLRSALQSNTVSPGIQHSNGDGALSSLIYLHVSNNIYQLEGCCTFCLLMIQITDIIITNHRLDCTSD